MAGRAIVFYVSIIIWIVMSTCFYMLSSKTLSLLEKKLLDTQVKNLSNLILELEKVMEEKALEEIHVRVNILPLNLFNYTIERSLNGDLVIVTPNHNYTINCKYIVTVKCIKPDILEIVVGRH